jgi:hypothetical protein
MIKRNEELLGFEMLEPRDMLAGNVTATLAGTILTITGDTAGNEIRIADNADSGIVVRGIGTTVNGGSAVFNSNAVVVSRININMKSGNDTVTYLAANLTGTLSCVGEAGNDAFAGRGGTVGHQLLVDLGSGNNTTTLNRVEVDSLASITGTNGRDTVTINHSVINGSLTLNTGVASTTGTNTSDIDTSTIKQSTINGQIVFNARDGVDLLDIGSTDFKGLNLDLGFGDDKAFVIRSNTVGTITAKLGTGTNGFRMTQSEVNDNATDTGNVNVTGGTLNDTVIVNRSTIEGFLKFDAFAGNDRVRVDSSSIGLQTNLLLGDGNDLALTIASTHVGNVTIDGGNGEEDIGAVASEFINDVVINTFAGNDDVITVGCAYGLVVTDALTVDTGINNDRLFAMGNVFQSVTNVIGGTGVNGISDGLTNQNDESNAFLNTFTESGFNFIQPFDWRAIINPMRTFNVV